MTLDLGATMRRVAARIALAAAVLGLGVNVWLLVAAHRWPAAIGAVLWAIIGVVAFLYLWNETDRSKP